MKNMIKGTKSFVNDEPLLDGKWMDLNYICNGKFDAQINDM